MEHMIKRSVTIYSWHRQVEAGMMTWEDCIRAAVKMGCNGIERQRDGPSVLLTERTIPAVFFMRAERTIPAVLRGGSRYQGVVRETVSCHDHCSVPGPFPGRPPRDISSAPSRGFS